MPDNRFTLVIGDKALSSWSLRPWLVLKHCGIPFDEVMIALRRPDTKTNILKFSSSGKVPALKHGDLTIWDSLAIAEYAADLYPDKGLWPADRSARALARAISSEMHSGFAELRTHLPMDFHAHKPMASIPEGAQADIRRIVALWSDARSRHGAEGPFLFGHFTIADAMYAPVATRFTTYAVDLARFGDHGAAEAYRATMMALPAMAEWGKGA